VPTPTLVWSARSPFGIAASRALAILAWFGVLLQLWLSIGFARAHGISLIGGLIIYFGYFTILTNIFVALVCTAGSLSPRAAHHVSVYSLPLVGCATAAILVVGLAYHALLREIWAPQGGEWVANLVLHYLVPAGALLHWMSYPYTDRSAWWAPLSWCWYPLAYFAYVLTRGELLFSYPYPFIDVLALGYTQTVINAIGFLIGFIVVGYLLLWLKRIQRMVRNAARTGPP
jgi:hypothetical protein